MADSKTTGLPALSALTGDETLYIVEDDDGTPVSRQISIEDFLTAIAARTELTAAFAPIGAKVCKVYRSAALTLTNNSATAIAWDAEETDTHGWHSNVTNNTRITPNVAGKYLVSANWRSSDSFADQKQAVLAIRKNGSDIRGGTDDRWSSGTTGKASPRAVTTVEMNGSTDYLEVVYFHLHGADRSLDTTVSSFEVVYLGT